MCPARGVRSVDIARDGRRCHTPGIEETEEVIMSAPAPTRRVPTAADPQQTIATLVVAFDADPIVRWFLPKTSAYLTTFPRLLQLLGDVAFPAGTADLAADGAAAAIWHPPGATADQEATEALFGTALAGREDAFAFLEQMEIHHPTDPHWYLPFIGVDPLHQGQGHGSRLLEHGLARCDRDGLPAYLEASSPRNRALYERHGFESFAEIRVADSPPLWPMLRPASEDRT
jgi:GNAT superfamily N-acetyltransferase